MSDSPGRAASYVIRPATPDDVGFLADVVVAATAAQGRVREDFDERAWRKGFESWTRAQVNGEVEGNTTSVIEVGGRLAGRLRVVRRSGGIELAGIQLSPDVQRRGIGTSIIESLQAEARAAEVPLELGVEKDNPHAHRLYTRLGFRPVGETEDEHRLRWSPTGS
ncbi:MAG: GNAT family N-acetyltransferase [Actinobacteria bacterium]|nr:GNAT family N-acetyltransferase [Actinomycetota bacterium]